MLRFIFSDIYNNIITKQNALAVTINIEENVPADDMTAVFPYFECNELCDVKVFDDDKIVFSGVIDEQSRVLSQNGEFIRIVSRSMAAHLLDNESMPICYDRPTLNDILSRHVLPYGISCSNSDELSYNGTLTVSKGMTNWQVTEAFIKNTTGAMPRITAESLLVVNGIRNDDEVVFSNNGDGIPYSDFTRTIKRCEEISTVHIKITNSTGYNTDIVNDNAAKRKILRERYINSVLTDTPIICADKMINRGKQKGIVMTLTTPKRLISILGNNAVIKGDNGEIIDSVYVSSVRYTLSSNKEQTAVTFKRKDDQNVAT